MATVIRDMVFGLCDECQKVGLITPQSSTQPAGKQSNMATAAPTLASGLKPPQPLKTDGKVTTNCK